MIAGIQVVGVLFGLLMLYLTFLHKKRNQFSAGEWSFWSLAWIAFICLTLLPNSLDFLVKDILRMTRPLDFFIILGFMFLIGLTFHNYSCLKQTQRKMEELVRKLALERQRK